VSKLGIRFGETLQSMLEISPLAVQWLMVTALFFGVRFPGATAGAAAGSLSGARTLFRLGKDTVLPFLIMAGKVVGKMLFAVPSEIREYLKWVHSNLSEYSPLATRASVWISKMQKKAANTLAARGAVTVSAASPPRGRTPSTRSPSPRVQSPRARVQSPRARVQSPRTRGRRSALSG
jgi:hypothetical protein